MSNVLDAVPPATEPLPSTRRAAPNQSLAMEVLGRLGVSVVLGWAAVAVGVVMVIVGYYLVSGTADVAEQLARFSSACVGGLTFIGIGGLLILSNHYRETALATDELRAEIAALRAGKEHVAPAIAAEAAEGVAAGRVVRVGAGATYHDPTCVFVDGKPDAVFMASADARRDGLRPCQVCTPRP